MGRCGSRSAVTAIGYHWEVQLKAERSGSGAGAVSGVRVVTLLVAVWVSVAEEVVAAAEEGWVGSWVVVVVVSGGLVVVMEVGMEVFEGVAREGRRGPGDLAGLARIIA